MTDKPGSQTKGSTPSPQTKGATAVAEPRTKSFDDNPERALLHKMELQAQKAIDEQKKLEEENTFYMSCPMRNDHIGILFTGDPRNRVIDHGLWESLYHKAGEPYPFRSLYCQECYIQNSGQKVEMRLTPIQQPDGSWFFVIPDKHAHRMIHWAPKSQVVGPRGLEDTLERKALGAAHGVDLIGEDLED